MWGGGGGGEDDGDVYEGFDMGEDADNDDDGGGADEMMNLSQRSARAATIDQIAFGNDGNEEALLQERATHAASLGDAGAIRAEEQVIDNTAYYNLLSLWTALYIRAKEGFALPIVFDPRTQHMIRNKRARFDF